MVSAHPSLPHIVGRYALYGEIAAGGMATVHYGRMIGSVGFARTVAVKRLHAQFAKDREFAAMFLDEARVAARIHHPNVIQTLDVVALEGELFLVMEYVQGESLARLIRASRKRGSPIPPDIVSAIVCGVLHGLHAAHEAKDESGTPLRVVHRDVSPQNVLLGVDGVPRVLDFGIAKAVGRSRTTQDGSRRGKLPYMAPEQFRGGEVDRRTDVYSAGVVLWETLTLQDLFHGENEGVIVRRVLERPVEAPSAMVPGELPKGLDEVTLRALAREPSARFETARQMALALEAAVPVASPTRVGEWIDDLAGAPLARRAKTVAMIERESGDLPSLEDNDDAAPLRQTEILASGVHEQSAKRAPEPPRRGWVVFAACAFAGAGIALLAASWSNAPPAKRAPPPIAAASIAPSAAPPAADPAPPPPTAAAPASVSAALAPGAASPPPTVTRTTASRRGGAPAPAPVVPAAPSASADKPCTITSFIDSSGIKHYVKQCD